MCARRVAAPPRSSFHCWTTAQRRHTHRHHRWAGGSSSRASSTDEATSATARVVTSSVPRRTSFNNGRTGRIVATTLPSPRDSSSRCCQQQQFRSLSISRHPDPLARHGTINSLDDPDDDDSHDDVDGASTTDDLDGGVSRGRKKVLTADDMDYLDEFLGLDQPSSTNKKWGGGKSGGRGIDYNKLLFSPNDNDDDGDDGDDDDDDIICHSSSRTSSRSNKGTVSPEDIADLAYRSRQRAINDELDTRTGRLWTESWTITDEEWMADETWDDIEEWKPSLATRKSLESVRVYDIDNASSSSSTHDDGGGGVKGVPTLTVMSTLLLPTTLPPNPGHGAPSIHAKHRKNTIVRKLRTSIQIVIHEDVLKIINHMTSHDERQAAVDVLYETIQDKVRIREPILSKLPNFAQLVEEGLEDVLTMVQESMARQAKVERKKKGMVMTELDNTKEIASTTTGTGVKSAPAGGDKQIPIAVDENVIDVMGVNVETPTPIFMDILAATRHLHMLQQEYKQHSNSATTFSSSSSLDVAAAAIVASAPPPPRPPPTTNTFFATTNDDNVPNLIYPLTNHPKMGVGRMVEEWQLAANKETKRIMIRDAMREISSIVVNGTDTTKEVQQQSSPSDDVVVDSTTSTEVMTTSTTVGGGGGATRVLVTGKRGVGKVRNMVTLFFNLVLYFFTLLTNRKQRYRLPPLLVSLHLLVSLVILLFTIPMVIDYVNMGITSNHVPIEQDCIIYLKLPRNFVTNY